MCGICCYFFAYCLNTDKANKKKNIKRNKFKHLMQVKTELFRNPYQGERPHRSLHSGSSCSSGWFHTFHQSSLASSGTGRPPSHWWCTCLRSHRLIYSCHLQQEHTHRASTAPAPWNGKTEPGLKHCHGSLSNTTLQNGESELYLLFAECQKNAHNLGAINPGKVGDSSLMVQGVWPP